MAVQGSDSCATVLQRHNSRKHWLCALCSAVLLSSLLFTGCHHGYEPRSLPPEFVAARVFNASQVDVARLRGPSVQSNLVYPGDILEVVLAPTIDREGRESPLKVRVADDGTAVLPLIGPVNVGGRTLPESEQVIRTASMQRGFFRDPSVGVQVNSRRFNRVTVAGAVNKPGVYELPAVASNLRTALLTAGGLSEHANPIADLSSPAGPDPRSGVITAASTAAGFARIDLVAASAVAAESPYLADGATVFVHEKPQRYVQTIGLIGNRTLQLPSDYDIHLLDVLAQAGGPKFSHWIADKVNIIRRVPGTGETITIRASIRKAKRDTEENVLLASGDVISVEENPMTFTIGTLSQVLGIGVTAAQIASLAP